MDLYIDMYIDMYADAYMDMYIDMTNCTDGWMDVYTYMYTNRTAAQIMHERPFSPFQRKSISIPTSRSRRTKSKKSNPPASSSTSLPTMQSDPNLIIRKNTKNMFGQSSLISQ